MLEANEAGEGKHEIVEVKSQWFWIGSTDINSWFILSIRRIFPNSDLLKRSWHNDRPSRKTVTLAENVVSKYHCKDSKIIKNEQVEGYQIMISMSSPPLLINRD